MRDVLRVIYEGDGLAESDLAPTPWQQVQRWVDDALDASAAGALVPEPTAMALATVDADGAPDVRTVLMRFLDDRGPGFATTTTSAKGRQFEAEPRVAATLTWPAMFRAIRFRGVIEPIEADVVEVYFSSRPWDSRISAWASHQSEPIADRPALQAAFDSAAQRWPDLGGEDDVPVPPSWGAYRIRPTEVEFWAGRKGRLHDRIVFTARDGQPGLMSDAQHWARSRRQP